MPGSGETVLVGSRLHERREVASYRSLTSNVSQRWVTYRIPTL